MASLYETKASINMVPGFSNELKGTAFDNENQLIWPCIFFFVRLLSASRYSDSMYSIVPAMLATSFAGGEAAYGSWRFSSL